MATYREPELTSPLCTVVQMMRLDILRTLTRADFTWIDQVGLLSTLIGELEQMRDRRARMAISADGESFAEVGRRVGISRSYARDKYGNAA